MTTSYYWIKLYYDMLDDYKVGNLPDSLKWRFIQCLLVAGETQEDGFLPPVDKMSFRIRPITPESLNDDLSRLAKPGLVELKTHPDGDERWFVTKFEERQGKISNAERQRSWRARKAATQDENNGNVTAELQDSNGTVTGRYVDKKRKDIDKKRKDSNTILIPENLKTKEFQDTWGDWKRYKGKTIKPMTYKKQLKEASAMADLYSVNDVIWVFEQSMANGWKGLFYDKLANRSPQRGAKAAPQVVGEF